MTLSEPQIISRPEQPFAGIRVQVPIPFGSYLQPLWKEVKAWLEKQGAAPSGGPYIRYLTTDMSKKLDIEVGFPTSSVLPGSERVRTGVFPAGRYAVTIYTGTWRGKGLMKATGAFLGWAEQHQVAWQKQVIDGVEWWDARIESYLTDPDQEPDPAKWQTELAFKVKEG